VGYISIYTTQYHLSVSKFEGLIIKMTSYNIADNKTIEETAQEIGIVVGKNAKMACKAVKAFGEGIQKGLDDNRPLEEKVGEVREAVVKGVMDGAELVGKAAGAFGDGIKKGIDDAKPLEEKAEDAGEALGKVVADGVDEIKSEIQITKDKIENI
jgi:hypothetical protein